MLRKVGWWVAAAVILAVTVPLTLVTFAWAAIPGVVVLAAMLAFYAWGKNRQIPLPDEEDETRPE